MLLVSTKNRCRLIQLYNCEVAPLNYYLVQKLQHNKVAIYTRYQGLVTCIKTYYKLFIKNIHTYVFIHNLKRKIQSCFSLTNLPKNLECHNCL